jgi:hypothetical protein
VGVPGRKRCSQHSIEPQSHDGQLQSPKSAQSCSLEMRADGFIQLLPILFSAGLFGHVSLQAYIFYCGIVLVRVTKGR